MLTTFADLAELSRNRPASAEEEGDQQVHSPREYFHAYLHSLDVEREELPESFRARLRRALRHYGVAEDAARRAGPALEEAVHRLFLAQQRMADQLPVGARAAGPLAERGRSCRPGRCGRRSPRSSTGSSSPPSCAIPPSATSPARCGSATSRSRSSGRTGSSSSTQAERLLAELEDAAARGDGDESMRRVEALVESPEPLIRLLAERAERQTAVPDPVLEVLTRRYYRSRDLQNVRSFLRRRAARASPADYELRGTPLHLVALMGPMSDLPAALAAVGRTAAEIAEPADAARRPLRVVAGPARRPRRDGGRAARDAGRPRRRCRPSAGSRSRCAPRAATSRRVTFRPSADGLAEDRVIRGMHPLTAQRLNLWRLKNFDGERLPSAEDTYLFHVTAKDHPNDERFIAMAEVRDLDAAAGRGRRDRRLPDRGAAAHRLPGQPAAGPVAASVAPAAGAQPDLPLRLAVDRACRCRTLATFAADGRAADGGRRARPDRAARPAAEEPGQQPREVALRFSYRPGTGIRLQLTDRPTEPMRPLDDYTQKVLSSRARGAVYPYELAPLLAGPAGTFVEHDLRRCPNGRLVPVDRPPGTNKAGIVVGARDARRRRATPRA